MAEVDSLVALVKVIYDDGIAELIPYRQQVGEACLHLSRERLRNMEKF